MEDGDDRETDQDSDEEKGCNDEPKNGLPGLVTPGDLGIEDQSDSEFDEEPEEENPADEEKHYKETEFYREYSDKTRNAQGNTKVEEEELKCPKLSNGELCEVHRSEDDLRI